MANIKNDVQINNENHGQSTFHASKNLLDTARKHQSVKKQAFGELKNVIHNQFQSMAFDDNSCTTKSKVITPPQENKHINVAEISKRSPCTTDLQENEDEIELLNYFDFDRSCCAKPYKSDCQIWSEMNAFDDSVIDSLIRGDGDHLDEEESVIDNEDYGLDDSGCEDLLNFDSSRLFMEPQNNDDICDLLPPPPPPPSSTLFDLPDLEDF